mgnify:CR=1 FL=1|tara:strand:- start:3240 stop:3704 length:465 start_codon:yes stop_codon:yes gene_type:complete
MLVVEYERKCAKYRKRMIDSCVDFAFCQLMSRVRNPVYINIRPIRNLTEKQGVYGDCMYEDDREFTIRIDVSIPPNEMMTTILHEMVHVWQYLTKRMVQNQVHEVRFQKVVYNSDMPYDERPWEIEAHDKEKELWEAFDKANAERNRKGMYGYL